MKSTAVTDFWRDFEKYAEKLSKEILDGDLNGSFQEVEDLLSRHGFDFCFDLTAEGDDAVLELTPEGDPEMALQIDDLVRAKPPISGWRIYSRRQRKALPDALTFVLRIYGIDVSDATFDLAADSADYKVTMYCSGLASFTPDEIHGLVSTLLDHVVGEEMAMATVAKIEGHAKGSGQLSLVEVANTLSVDPLT